jgi:GntR family transcriptional repressor for pyruvate dehydrogenase complex
MEEIKVSLKPVVRKSLYLKISDSIYSYIKVNRLQPGDKLPSERDMSNMLQTSRNSVREALRILEDRGLIYVKTGRGVFIKDPYGENSTLSIRLDECSIADIQELQNTLEHQAVLNAINRATIDQKQELISIASEMVNLLQENIYSHTLDHSFHSKLYESGNNTAIHQLIIKIREDRFVRQVDSKSGNDAIWLPTIPEQLVLANAIWEKDSTVALKAIDAINDYGYNLKLET